MKEHPIIFSTEMVRAILEGRKTMTRRVVKPQPDLGLDPFDGYSHIEVGKYHPTMIDKDEQEYAGDEIFGAYTDDGEWGWKFPYGQVGDRLWVRETHYLCIDADQNIRGDVIYKASEGNPDICKGEWRPSIHMPRWASRIDLEITEVRVERLQEISYEDFQREGIQLDGSWDGSFARYWDSLNTKRGYSWDTNPWVWCISFEKVKE